MCRLIDAKFCTVVNTRQNFIMSVQNFGGLPQKILLAKTCKIWPISDDFKVWQRISLERMKIFEIGQVHFVPRLLLHRVKKVW